MKKIFSYLFFNSLTTITILTLSSVANLLFIKISALYLGKPDFGTLACLVNVMMIIMVPFGAFQSFMSRQIARLLASRDTRQGYLFFKQGLNISILAAVGIGIFFILFRTPLSDIFHTDSSDVFFLLGIIIVLLIPFQIFLGFFQGAMSFKSYCIPILVESTARLMVGYIALQAGYGLEGLIFSLVCSYAIAISLCAGLVRKKAPGAFSASAESEEKRKYSMRNFMVVFLSFLAYSIMVFSDILLVKYFFSPEEAGSYGAATNIGRFFFAIPLPLITVMYPKIAELHQLGQRKETWFVLGSILFATATVCFAFIAGCFFFSPEIIRLFLDAAKYDHTGYLIRYMSVIMTFFVFINVLLHYNIAKGRHIYLFVIAIGAAGQIALICLFNDSLRTVMQVLLTTSSLLFTVISLITGIEDIRDAKKRAIKT